MGRIHADYVIIGAGSAGCVLADRLSEDGAAVAVLEAGPHDWHPWIRIPAGMQRLRSRSLFDWDYHTEPDFRTAHRSLRWPRGKVLGGTSAINGMLYVRGHRADFDRWAAVGCHGWGASDVWPYFARSETYAAGDAAVRGKNGPLHVENDRTTLPLTRQFVKAAQQAGHPFTADYNSDAQEGVGYAQLTRHGRFRASTARSFLDEARSRPHLRVLTGSLATRLLFQGRRCIGVEYRQSGEVHGAFAAREVILCTGTVNSPHLLQLSGIGPARHLQGLGIDVVLDAPEVGRNLRDHYVVRVSNRVDGALTLNKMAQGPRLAYEVLRWLFCGTGALTFGVISAVLFCRSRAGLFAPDLQLLFTPGSYDRERSSELSDKPGMTIMVCPVHPQSRVPHARATTICPIISALPAAISTTKSGPAAWDPTVCQWSIRDYAFAASTDCGWLTPR